MARPSPIPSRAPRSAARANASACSLAFASAVLLGLALPEEYGGGEMGFFGLCVLLQEVGRTVAPIPAHATLVLGAEPIARFGSDAQKKEWLPGIAEGHTVVTDAELLHEPELVHDDGVRESDRVRRRGDDDGSRRRWRRWPARATLPKGRSGHEEERRWG